MVPTLIVMSTRRNHEPDEDLPDFGLSPVLHVAFGMYAWLLEK
jgi:hypothetical protein